MWITACLTHSDLHSVTASEDRMKIYLFSLRPSRRRDIDFVHFFLGLPKNLKIYILGICLQISLVQFSTLRPV